MDDVNIHLISIRERLKGHYDVYPAQSVEQLFIILEKVIPELILLDINMLEVDGYGMVDRLKNDARYAGIPVIFLTGDNDKVSLLLTGAGCTLLLFW